GLQTVFGNQPGAGTCAGIICSCGFGCNPRTVSGERSAYDCNCPTGYAFSDPPFVQFATGLGWGGDGSVPFISSLMPYRPHSNETPIPLSAKGGFVVSIVGLNR